MITKENPHDDHVKDILNAIRNQFVEKQLMNVDLDVISTYLDILTYKKLPKNVLDSEVLPTKVLKMIGEYNACYGKFEKYKKYFEINIDIIKKITAPDKNLKITFVDLNDALGIVLHDENNKVFELYIGNGKTVSVSQEEMNELKVKFEDEVKGLKPFLNNDLTNKLGIPSKNTATITINYKTNFSTIDWEELEKISLFPAIDAEDENGNGYKHRITLVMFFSYKTPKAAGTVFYDTFQICPPHGTC